MASFKGAAALGCLLLLVACGGREQLTPPEGKSLPPKRYGAETPPTAEQLLEPPILTRPGRSTDLLRQSEERPEDPFELPPS